MMMVSSKLSERDFQAFFEFLNSLRDESPLQRGSTQNVLEQPLLEEIKKPCAVVHLGIDN